MNLKRGINRISIALGFAGAIAGSMYSYSLLQTVQKHDRFISLVNSPRAQTEKAALRREVEAEHEDWKKQEDWFNSQIEMIRKEDREKGPIYAAGSDKSGKLALGYANARSESEMKMDDIQRSHSEIGTDGIKSIAWTERYGSQLLSNPLRSIRDPEIRSITTEDLQVFIPTPNPSFTLRAAIYVLPILGFLSCWGLVRCVGWIILGF